MARTKHTARRSVGTPPGRKQLVGKRAAQAATVGVKTKLANQYAMRLTLLQNNLSKHLEDGAEDERKVAEVLSEPEEIFKGRPDDASENTKQKWVSKERAITATAKALRLLARARKEQACCLAAIVNGLSAVPNARLHERFDMTPEEFKAAAGHGGSRVPLTPEDKYGMAQEENGWILGCGGGEAEWLGRLSKPHAVQVELVCEDGTGLVRVPRNDSETETGVTGDGHSFKVTFDSSTLKTGTYHAVRKEEGSYELSKKTAKKTAKKGSFRLCSEAKKTAVRPTQGGAEAAEGAGAAKLP